MYKVTNTIDNTSETFHYMEAAKEHVQIELNWWNATESESSAYAEDDFIIDEI